MYQVGTMEIHKHSADPGGIDSLERKILKKIYYYDKYQNRTMNKLLWKKEKGHPKERLPKKGNT